MNTKKIWAMTIVATALVLGGCGSADEGVEAESGEDAVTAARASARIETFEGEDGKHYFHLVAGNGEVVLQSEAYESAQGAENGVAAVLDAGRATDAFEIREARDGEHYFVLKAANREVIGVSETYVSKANAERALDTTKRLVREIRRQTIAAARTAKFETFSGADGLTYFHMRATNGQTVLQSQGYQSSAGAKKGIRSVKENGFNPARFEVLEARDGQWYFRLKAGNNEIIGRSEMYASKQSAERGRDTVMTLIRQGAVQ
jgi:uncharacterized protein